MKTRLPFWLFLAALVAVLASMALCRSPGPHAAGLAALHLAGFGLLLACVACFPETRGRTAWLAVIMLGMGLRLLFAAWFEPGSDVARYVWEGLVQRQGANPYLLPPDSPSLSELAREVPSLFSRINHKDHAAIYGPLAELGFRAVSRIAPDPAAFRNLIAVLDCAALALLALLAARRGLGPARLLLYAANPLVLVFIAGEGHLDGAMVFFLLAGLVCLDERRFRTGFFLLGAAGAVKYLAFFVLPFVVTRDNAARLWWALVSLAALLPFAPGGWDIFAPLLSFGSQMHYSDALAALARALTPGHSLWLLAPALAAVLAWIWLFEHDRDKSVFYALGAVLLFLPTLHPWYLALVAPLAALFPHRAWLWLMAAQAAAYAPMGIEYATGAFAEPWWLRPAVYLPFFWLLAPPRGRDTMLFPARTYPEARTLAVVVPALNEARHIAACLASLEGEAVDQVVVADGGSSDETAGIAARAGALVVQAPAGRGGQIAAGIRRTSADVVMVVHADTRVSRGLARRVLDGLNANPGLAGGASAMRFTSGEKPRLPALLNNLRARTTGISFGDQAQFVRRAALEAMGGFPRLRLMEDVELSLALKRHGGTLFLARGPRVSPRRWKGSGFAAKLALVLHLFFSYLIKRRLGVPPGSCREQYRRYYG